MCHHFQMERGTMRSILSTKNVFRWVFCLTVINPFGAGTVFRRQNPTSKDGSQLQKLSGRKPITWVFK